MCPTCMDPTQQSPQHWQIIVPRLKQIYDFSSDCHRHLKNPSALLFTPCNYWDAWSKLVRPPRFAQWRSAQRCSIPHLIAPASTIERLPPEILGLIIASSALLESDVVAFGLASPVFWPHVLHHVACDCKDAIVSWAGAEIANMGSFLTDLPLPFEKDSLLALSVSPVSDHGSMCTARLLNYATWSEYKLVGVPPQAQWKAAFGCQDDVIAKEHGADFFAAIAAISRVALTKAWVLRNLTTRGYVRCRFDTDTERVFVETDLLRVSLEDVLLLRFCWTLKDRLYYLVERGCWAGHAFDIVLSEEEMPAMKSRGWKDITDEIVDEAEWRLNALVGMVDHRDPTQECYRLVRAGTKGMSFNRG